MGKKYSEDFKNTIIDLYNSGKGATELAREYGIHIQNIYKWLEKRQEVKIDDETVSAEKIIKLKKEIAKLKEENEILKKATAIFAKRN